MPESPPRAARRLGALALLFAAGLAGCSEDPAGPAIATDVTVAQLAGSYEATSTTFVGNDNGTEIDVLALGGYIAIELHQDGTTEGTMFVPEGNEDGSDYTADLMGTWDLSTSGVITFDHDADTFIRDVDWLAYEDGTVRTAENPYARVVLTPL